MRFLLHLLLVYLLVASTTSAAPKHYAPNPNAWLDAEIISVEPESRFLTLKWVPDRMNRVPWVDTLGTDLAKFYFVHPSGKRESATLNDLKAGMRVRLMAAFGATPGATLIYIPKP